MIKHFEPCTEMAKVETPHLNQIWPFYLTHIPYTKPQWVDLSLSWSFIEWYTTNVIFLSHTYDRLYRSSLFSLEFTSIAIQTSIINTSNRKALERAHIRSTLPFSVLNPIYNINLPRLDIGNIVGSMCIRRSPRVFVMCDKRLQIHNLPTWRILIS